MAVTTYENGNLYQILIIRFKPDPDQLHKVIDSEGIEELTTFQDGSAGKIKVKGKEFPVSLNIDAVK